MPSGGRGFAPPKSAQWVVSHYQIGFNNTLRNRKYAPYYQGMLTIAQGCPRQGRLLVYLM